MNLNDLLKVSGVDPQFVLILRHCPTEPRLRRVLPWLAMDKPNLFNAYQQTQGEKLENSMKSLAGNGFVASFIGIEPGKAHFVGLYAIGKVRPLTLGEYWRVPEHVALKELGMDGFTEREGRPTVHWFDLEPTDFHVAWKGKLIVGWPPPERSWWRRAHLNDMPVHAILEESAFDQKAENWNEISYSWTELQVLPTRMRRSLSEWRGIYYILDESDGKGYVGSAYGENNLLGRWQGYAASGHGGNRLLRRREPRNFKFSILERVSPDMKPEDVVAVENTWKLRLHTRAPAGLNDN